MEKPGIEVGDIKHLINEAYVPFAEVRRAIPWPPNVERLENDAEHTFSLSLITGAVASEIGLDPGKTVTFALVHDLVEIYAGDTPVWDEVGLTTKQDREEDSLDLLKIVFDRFPWITDTIIEYESLESEEACLVYALDKLIALLMIMKSGGHLWKTENVTFEQHMQKYSETKRKIAKHPKVLGWYEAAIAETVVHKEKFFGA
jgi:5'-deoxynucleotidase YfbR-like HD superfamily hydrolase